MKVYFKKCESLVDKESIFNSPENTFLEKCLFNIIKIYESEDLLTLEPSTDTLDKILTNKNINITSYIFYPFVHKTNVCICLKFLIYIYKEQDLSFS